MTVALVIKVNDGIVLAADSASTLTDGSGAVANTYNNANKIFNLHKALPVGAMTWGLGNIGPSSIATLAKDMRRRFQEGRSPHESWRLDPDTYSVGAVAEKARTFLYDEKYVPLASRIAEEQPGAAPGDLGFLIAGYSCDADEAEAWVMQIDAAGEPALEQVLPQTTGAQWWGQPEAISRIVTGMSLAMPRALANLDIGLDLESAMQVHNALVPQLQQSMVPPPMPIQDAIDLADFLVYATAQYVRFTPGPPVVGGPIEIATITKHEGFKWVRRKHYFDARLNRTTGRDA
ncbi:hypothetical protein [Agrococcus sp. TF02-05]|uniref:hypothetical protein n=1 Tax=Agrococcus sp. TF02-05 TaxID=2815211 RepID=UPI001AA11016|nr:hypothetical protein [Agrococcus sp. TF02-05]MBO1769912.1 hypothetical protein [Agrococcus sp. TF02-05]